MPTAKPDDIRDLRSYGRRRGRQLSPHQAMLWREVLPRVAVPCDSLALRDLARLFSPPAREVWLEIGFGGGEHLLWQAARNPDVGFIGCEPFENGVVKVLTAVAGMSSPNIRVHAGDARELLRALPSASVARAFILFPDPWPKKRHQKRRLVAEPMLAELARILRPDGELRLATDIPDYARGMLRAVRAEGSFVWSPAQPGPGGWRRRTDDWPPTRYEQKAYREGRRCVYFRFRRR